MKFYKILSLIFILIISNKIEIFSQNSFVEYETFAIHPKLGLLFNQYTSEFKQFENSVDCGLFKEGSGRGWLEGIAIEYLIAEDSYLSFQFSLSDRSGTLTLPNYFPSRNMQTGKVDTVHTSNELETSLSYLELQPDIRFVLLDKLINGPLRAIAGFRFGFPLQNKFKQSEKIVSPSNAVFISPGGIRTQDRVIATGTISDINSVTYGISVGLENLLHVGKKFFLSQALIFDYNFNDIAKNVSWNTYALRLELGLRFSIVNPPKPVIEPEPEPEPEPVKEIIPEPVLVPVLTHNLVQSDNLRIETGNELLATIPLVNSVFFDKNSAVIPDFYYTNNKTTDYFSGNPVEKHSYLLPRIAEIVKKNSKAKIELESSTSGATVEPEGITLSKSRAEAVKNSLIKLGIDEKLITINSKLTPRFPSNQDFKEGIEENQRVDIIVKNAPVQEYVDLQKYANINGFIEVNVDYKDLKAHSNIIIQNNLTKQDIAVTKPGNYSIKVDERIDLNKSPFELKTNVKSDELQDTKVKLIDLNKLEKTVIDFNLDNFQAILTFNYNSSELSDDNKGLLKQLSEKLPIDATIIILGSADLLGTTDRNAQLENERADNTRKYLQSVAPNKFKFETGRSTEKFEETTPQGRFLNRSIKIKVKK